MLAPVAAEVVCELLGVTTKKHNADEFSMKRFKLSRATSKL